MSKIFEKLIHTRLFDLVVQHNLLFKYQFAFQPKLSTEHATLFLQKLISESLENHEYGIGIFIDLKKAFDTLDHDILWKKLEIYGIRGTALELIKSYITGRKQFVSYKNVSSSLKTIICGIPQGSILGPLLFLLYINDFYRISDIFTTIQFADDTNLFASDSSLPKLIELTNTEIPKFVDWIKANRLSLNLLKTKYIVFTARNKPIECDIAIIMEKKSLERVTETKFVGIIFDEHLSFKPQILKINNKVSKAVGIINRVKNYLPVKALRILYFTLVYPHITYCSAVWSTNYVSNLKRIEICQRKIVRIITRSAYDAHSAPLFKELQFLQFKDVRTFSILKIVYTFHNQTNTSYNRLNLFIPNERQPERYRIPFGRLDTTRFSIAFTGPKLWNELGSAIKSTPSIHQFKILFPDPFLKAISELL